MAGDVPAEELRSALHRVADEIADYLASVGELPVLPPIEPGAVAGELQHGPPEQPESLDRILDDYKRLIEPNVTHWNHPGFLAYFAITGSGPGIVGEALAAALNVNAMLWRTSPAATELETVTCDWLRQMLGLEEGFSGHINDTASISTFLALAAARHRLDPEIREVGLAGRPNARPLTVYASDQAHSSVDKAVMALGLGHRHLRRIECDERFRLVPGALAAAIADDREAGLLPMAVVATAGTTSTTSVDPLPEIGEICAREGLWFHVDAAYAGSAAICEEYRPLFRGWENADSIVTNPHKWLFTPVDCSVLFVKDESQLRSAFSLVPEYLSSQEGQTNLMDLGIQLGRRFRSLKLWMVIRAFGVEGLKERIRDHCRLALRFAAWIRESEAFELSAPVPFSAVCFRWLPGGDAADSDAMNEALLERVNSRGPVFLSHTKLDGRYVLRAAIGNLKTSDEHIEQAWEIVRECAQELSDRVMRGADSGRPTGLADPE